MSVEALLWVKAVHIFGILMWIGTLMGLYQTIFAIGAASGGRDDLIALARKIAMAMDVGALIAIGGGLGLLFGIDPSPMKLPWMHVKLTLVAVFLGFHVYGRIKLGKLRKGETSTPPPILFALLNLILVAIVIMAVVKPIK
jgi:putative membrane protein